jgi:membrane-associated protease RseP (regulator of RpoE activity)
VDWLALDVFQLPAAERWAQLGLGLLYAGPFLGVLAVHEFGHYFTARYNKVRTSLPFFLPMPFGLGTFGAVIRIKERIFSRREFFDIGLAGPLAGLLVAVPPARPGRVPARDHPQPEPLPGPRVHAGPAAALPLA